MKRVLIGGIVGGIVVFTWGAFAHMVLPTGEMGIKQIPNEDAVIAAMKSSIQEPGFYFFPGMDMSHKPTEDEQKAWNAKYEAGPTGILVYHASGSTPLSPKQLFTELPSNVSAALLAAFVLSHVAAGFVGNLARFSCRGVFVAWLRARSRQGDQCCDY